MASKGDRTSSAPWGEDRVNSRKYGQPKVKTRASTFAKNPRVKGTPQADYQEEEEENEEDEQDVDEEEDTCGAHSPDSTDDDITYNPRDVEEISSSSDERPPAKSKKRGKSPRKERRKKKKETRGGSPRTPLFSYSPPARARMPVAPAFHGAKKPAFSFNSPETPAVSPAVGNPTPSPAGLFCSPEVIDAFAQFMAANPNLSKGQANGSKRERGALPMALVLVSDGFIGVGKERSKANNNSFIMAASQASSFAATMSDKQFAGWLRRAVHGARHKVYEAGRNAVAAVVENLADERAKTGKGTDNSSQVWNELSNDILALGEEADVVGAFEKTLFTPYVQAHRGGSGGRPLHLADIVGGASEIKLDVLESILKPVLIAAITTMRALSAMSEGFSWERARQVAECWVLTPNGGHGRDNVFESSYSRTFWRCLFMFATQGERYMGLIQSIPPQQISTEMATEYLFPHLSVTTDGGGNGDD